jgi:hypothetical protein
MKSLHPSLWAEENAHRGPAVRLVAPPLAHRLAAALATEDGNAVSALADERPTTWRDTLLTLSAIYDLHTAPVDDVAGGARFQHHPGVAALKWALETELLAALDELSASHAATAAADEPGDAVAAMRRIAAGDMVPAVYEWLATDATWHELVEFLTYEGGPDAGFDDLVAAAQIGLEGRPKVAMADNYWDEMGNGTLGDVHTELHHRLVAAIGMPRIPRDELPTECLERSVFGGLLATNRHLQPEMVGALGLIELQAGPRCRKVVAALRRLDAPADAFPFYEEHATVDPRHGKIWLDEVIAPLAGEWGDRMLRGARWRQLVNARFFAAMAERFGVAASE